MKLSGLYTLAFAALLLLSSPPRTESVLVSSDNDAYNALSLIWNILTLGLLSSPCDVAGVSCSGLATDLNQRIIGLHVPALIRLYPPYSLQISLPKYLWLCLTGVFAICGQRNLSGQVLSSLPVSLFQLSALASLYEILGICISIIWLSRC